MRDKIIKNLNKINPNIDFCQSEDFFEDELIDSFGILTFISLIENEFGISIDGNDISAENFQSVDSIEALLLRKKEGEK